jgi:hypothetical protein
VNNKPETAPIKTTLTSIRIDGDAPANITEYYHAHPANIEVTISD